MLAGKIKDRSRLATAYSYKGLNYVAKGNDTVALKFYDQSLSIARGTRNDKQEANVLHNTGQSYFNLSDYPHALEIQKQAFDLYKKLDDKQGMAAALNSIGVIFLYLSDYPNALNNYLDALRIYEQLGSRKDIGKIFSNLGIIYYHLENYDTALMYHFRALDIFEKAGERYSMQNTLANIGNTYDNAGKPEKALAYYKQALSINEKLGNNRGIASDLINTGIVYYGMADYAKAFTYLKKSLKLYEQLKDKYGMGVAYTYLSGAYSQAPADILMQEGVKPSQRYIKALACQQKGLQLAQEIGNLYSQSESWGNLSDIYAGKKDFARSLEAYKNHITLRDSIFSREKKSQISRMQMQYEFDKREAAAKAEADKKEALAAAEIRRQHQIRNSIMTGAGVLLMMAVISFIFYKRKRDAEERQKEAELEAQVADTEMKALRAQMNPHFIFNSLNSISDYISKHDPVTADRYLTKFSKMMRLILEYSDHREISLAEDLKALELYMQLESLRLNNKFTYEIKIDEHIDQETTMVPPLILQPFVENSIWHGIARKQGRGRILVEISREEKMINCIIEDNGVGRKMQDKAGLDDKRSLGMKLTKSRIDIMNNNRGADSTVTLFDLAEGLRVELKLPLILNF
jgi:tetratricopeptide (TPR) repeat protein